MLSIAPSSAAGGGSATKQAAALRELLAETAGRRPVRFTELDEAALLFIAVHPALSHDWQEVLLLRSALWFEPEEIARITGLTAASVETRLRGAYRRLRSTGLGAPLARVGMQERTHRILEILERLYWRVDELAPAHADLSERLQQSVLSRAVTLAAQGGAVGGEANALLAFLSLSRARMGEPGPVQERGSRYLQAAEHAGASGRYLWLARIIAAYLKSATPDWQRIALMWEVIHEMDRPSAPRWIGNPLARLTEDGPTG